MPVTHLEQGWFQSIPLHQGCYQLDWCPALWRLIVKMQCLSASVCHLGTPTASGSVTDQRWLAYRHFHQTNSSGAVGLDYIHDKYTLTIYIRQIYTDKIYICTTICSCAVNTIPVSLLTVLNSVPPLSNPHN